MKQMVVVYDWRQEMPYEIQDIVGKRLYADILVRKKSLREHWRELFHDMSWPLEWVEWGPKNTLPELDRLFETYSERATKVILLKADCGIRDRQELKNLLAKAPYVTETVTVRQERSCLTFFSSPRQAREFIASYEDRKETDVSIIDTQCLFDLRNPTDLIRCLTGGFDARFFNTLHGDDHTVIKTSTNVDKLHREYTYFHLLPESMKRWFVFPYGYEVRDAVASYRMERYHMTDVAIKWIHGAFTLEEFHAFLECMGRFLRDRPRKAVTATEAMHMADALYLDKVRSRLTALREHPSFPMLESHLRQSACIVTLEDLLQRYERVYRGFFGKNDKMGSQCCIGHGDLCFSNILYNKDLRLIKLIDPKGALMEEELWTDPYYDLAKLSHSICGQYDFLNNGLYELRLNDALQLELVSGGARPACQDAFLRMLEQEGYDVLRVRICECSLFLSMTPLHMDNPHKVLAFLLNAANLLGELEKQVRQKKGAKGLV